MFLRDMFRRSLRSLLSARMRTALTCLAIAVGAFALTLTLGASNGAESYADQIIKNNFDPTELIVTKDAELFNRTDRSKPQEYDPGLSSVTNAAGATQQVKTLSDDDINRLRAIPGVSTVEPDISLSLQYLTRDGQRRYAATLQAYDSYSSPELAAGSVPSQIPTGTLILPEGFVSPLGFSSPQDAVGKQVRLSVRKQVDQSALLANLLQNGAGGIQNAQQQTSQEKVFTVIAVTKTPSTLIQPGTALYLKTSASELQALNDYATEGSTSYRRYISASAKVSDGTDTAKLYAAQDRIKAAGYGAQSVLDTQKIITQVISVLQGIVTVFGLIAVVASVFGIVNTMYISVLQRTREIGLMKALGLRKRNISLLFLMEAALIGLLGGVLGSVVAVVLGTLLNPTISKQLELGSARLLQFDAGQLILLVAALVVIAVIAGLFPARKASRLDPVEALRTE